MAKRKQEKPRIWLVIILGIILFFGTGLAATYFNEDVGMDDVQQKLFYYICGEEANDDLLTLMFCIGIALGVVIFFNPFMIGKKGGKPTPMELTYFEYTQQAEQFKQAEQQPSNNDGKSQ